MWDHERSDIGHGDYCEGVRDEDGNCPECERRHAEQAAYWRLLYEGEKRAGLLEPIEEQPPRRYMSVEDAMEMGGWDPVDGWPRTASDFPKRGGGQ